MKNERNHRALQRLLVVLRPYLSDLVLIGGWVPELYRLYGAFNEWRTKLSGTIELDLLVGTIERNAERPLLAELLQAEGLRPDEGTMGAVWSGATETGEMIEFFVPHRGLARTIGRPRRVETQQGIAAIELTDLEVLATHTRTVTVVQQAHDGTPMEFQVIVPTLGAYIVAKAATFMQRSSAARADDRAKRSKDLVYIRDVMAAGREVAIQVETDIRAIANSSTSTALRKASNNLGQLDLEILDKSPAMLEEAATELAERDGISTAAAMQDLRGHLTDLHEILRDQGSTD